MKTKHELKTEIRVATKNLRAAKPGTPERTKEMERLADLQRELGLLEMADHSMKAKTKIQIPPEQIGRKWKRTRWEIHSREVGTETWFSGCGYGDEESARDELKRLLETSRYTPIGATGLTLDTGPDTGERYERRLVRVDSDLEVVDVGIGR